MAAKSVFIGQPSNERSLCGQPGLMHSNPRPFASSNLQNQKAAETEELKKQALRSLFDAKAEGDKEEGEEDAAPDGNIEEISNHNDRLPPKVSILKPVFIPPSRQANIATASTTDLQESGDLRFEESRKILSTVIAADSATGKKGFEELRIAGTPCDVDSVDDSDNVDEEEEKDSWREREAARIRWEMEQRRRWKEEAAEAEGRRDTTEEERLKLDAEKEREWAGRVEQERGEMKFLQKYYHKGAFYQNPEDPLFRRNFTEATGPDSGVARDTLPAVLQVRNFGKKGRSKWTHLSAEDTTAFDYGWGDKKNPVNYQPVVQMGGMRGDLENPATKRPKNA